MDSSLLTQLLARIGSHHVRERLKLQAVHSAVRFGTRGHHFYPENLDFLSPYLKWILKFSGLWNRGVETSLDYKIVEQTVGLRNLPAAFEGFRILHLSDLHVEGIADKGRKLRTILSQLEYDLCVLTGDFRYLTFGDYRKTILYMADLVKVIQCPHGTIGILGNHDFLEMVPGLEGLGITLLLNESIPITRGNQTIWLIGVDDPHWYETDDLAKALRSVPSHADPVKVLLAHSTDLIKDAAAVGVDYYLCGHTHGGQICLPKSIPIITGGSPRKFASGPWRYQNMKGYTSPGVGVSVVPVRFLCRPEIIVHQLIREKRDE